MLTRAGLDPALYRASALARRLPACLRQLRVATPAAARTLLARQPELLPLAMDSILIGVSEFARDPEVFAQLRSQHLPNLLRDQAVIRVYAAGVSEGQELYSLAMVLAEAGVLGTSRLLGVDCRPQAIDRARQGWYPESSFTNLPNAWWSRYLLATQAGYRVCRELRQQTEWQVADLAHFRLPRPCQLLLFRNVAIYMRQPRLGEVWENLVGQLAPNGLLITGRAECPPPALGLQRLERCIYRRTES